MAVIAKATAPITATVTATVTATATVTVNAIGVIFSVTSIEGKSVPQSLSKVTATSRGEGRM